MFPDPCPAIAMPRADPEHCLQPGEHASALGPGSSEPTCLVGGCCLLCSPGNPRDSRYSLLVLGIVPQFVFAFTLGRSPKPLEAAFARGICGLTPWML